MQFKLILCRLWVSIINILGDINFYQKRGFRMEYLSVTQTAEKWGIKQRRIRVLCAEGRISGAYKVGTYWLIPSDADKPKDERIKSGKYIKEK